MTKTSTSMSGNIVRPTSKEFRVLIADDSATVRMHLANLINATPGLRVIGEARDGEEVIELTRELRPDVISMDINMPRLNGLDATQRIMSETPTPVVVVSTLVDRNVDLAFQAMESGALAVVEKPPHRNEATFETKRQQFIKTLVAMAGVKVIRRGRTGLLSQAGNLRPTGVTGLLPQATPEILAIGASAGGPSALTSLLRDLPPDLPIPIVVVQHMAPDFINGLARWLARATRKLVTVAGDGHSLEAGVVHLSPGTAHLTVSRVNGVLVSRLIDGPGHYRYQPSIDILFHSVAISCGAAAIGLILTGMGDDGADGLLAMRRAGARTFAQDQASSIVFGMPGAAVERGAAERVVSLANLPAAIAKVL